jgi:hypothetical protein
MNIKLSIILPLLASCAFARHHTKLTCEAIRDYDDHIRAEVRGEKPGELERECTVKPAPKKAAAPKKKK